MACKFSLALVFGIVSVAVAARVLDEVESEMSSCSCTSSLSVASIKNNLSNCTDPNYTWAEPRIDSGEEYYSMLTDFAAEADVARASKKSVDLVWYGDNLFQCMRYRSNDCRGVTEWYEDAFKKYSSVVWGLGSETVSSLMWRIRYCNGPEDLGAKAIVVQIGSQDVLRADQDPETWESISVEIAEKIIDVCDYIVDNTEEAQVLLLGLLPMTGYDSKGKHTMTMTELNKKAMETINGKLREYGRRMERVSFIDANWWFIRHDGESIRTQYMKGLLPTARGYSKIAHDLRPFLEQYVD